MTYVLKKTTFLCGVCVRASSLLFASFGGVFFVCALVLLVVVSVRFPKRFIIHPEKGNVMKCPVNARQVHDRDGSVFSVCVCPMIG